MKRNLCIAALAGLALAAAAWGEQAARGHLVLIGGGEKPPEAMRRFAELAGCPEEAIAVVPTASSEPDTGDYYLALFRELGCRHVTVLEVRSPDDARRPELVASAAQARGIFFSGGDQARITAAFAGSPLLAAIRQAHEGGAVVGGTSAGTACQSPRMITGEGDFTVVRAGAVELVEGLGFLPGVILDQHFFARQRSNRLLSVVLEHPDLLGVGVDEDTAIWVRPDRTFQVLGARSVAVLDARGAAVNRRLVEGGGDALGVHGLAVHVLLPGEVFDLELRRVVVTAPVAGVSR